MPLTKSVAGCFAAMTLPMLLASQGTLADSTMDTVEAVLKRAPIVDGHNDLPHTIREDAKGDVDGYDIAVSSETDTDIPRLRQGGVGTQFWSVYVPSSLEPGEAMLQQLEQIDIAHRIIERYPKDLVFAGSVSDIDRAFGEGRVASLIGIEGLHTMANSLGALRSYYRLGVRYATLTHFHTHDWADSATDAPRHDGLSEFGESVIGEMNRLGMLVDLSHVAPATMRDVLSVTKAPVIFSHSSARGLTDHPRNVPDDVLTAVADNGGIVMVTFIPNYVNETRNQWESALTKRLKGIDDATQLEQIREQYEDEFGQAPEATLKDVADHIDHVARIAGFDHVGIGSDFYGQTGNDLVTGLEDVSKFPDLLAELVDRGWTEGQLEKLTRHNFMRVFREVEAASARLKQYQGPALGTVAEPKE